MEYYKRYELDILKLDISELENKLIIIIANF
jgi:hypothetical protein